MKGKCDERNEDKSHQTGKHEKIKEPTLNVSQILATFAHLVKHVLITVLPPKKSVQNEKETRQRGTESEQINTCPNTTDGGIHLTLSNAPHRLPSSN